MALSLSTLFFILINLAVTPFYGLMVAAPRSPKTQRLLGSLWPVTVPIAVYLTFMVLILFVLRPDVLDLWRQLYVANGMFSSRTVLFLSQVYGQFPEYAALHGWVHIVVGDLFMARWAYLQAVKSAAPSWTIALAALLTVFLGPVGVLFYLLVRRRFPPLASGGAG